MPRIKVTAVARKPIDTAGVVTTLVELARRVRDERKAEQTTDRSPRKEASDA
jgi:hypothetical protein